MSYDWRGKSYFRLLHATWATCDKDRDSEEDHPSLVPYMPNYLDDPEFRQGRHRHVVRGDKNIGPVVSSILLFVKPNDLKEVRWILEFEMKMWVGANWRRLYICFASLGAEQEVPGEAHVAEWRPVAEQDPQSQARDAVVLSAARLGSRDSCDGVRLL